MNLYLISQQQNNSYDTYDKAVVAAPDPQTARQMYPGNGMPFELSAHQWAWTKPEHVNVTHIGVAAEGTQQGVICASFNAS